jgi:hypothetical protein
VGDVLGTLLQADSTITSASPLHRPSPLKAATPAPTQDRFCSWFGSTDNIFPSNLIDNDSHLNYTSTIATDPGMKT